jgi:deferrochelatase/peroxidase EfeB
VKQKPERRPHEQAGILNRPPEHAIVAAFTFTEQHPASSSVEALRAVLRAELTSDLEDMSGAALEAPPAETGELGFDDDYDRNHLTVTAGFSESGLTKLGATRTAPAAQTDTMPSDLITIPWDRLGDHAVITAESGDVLLQICADSLYLVEHVLRRIETDLREQLTLIWAHSGTQRYSTRAGRTSRREGRALLGFLDGTSNLDPAHDPADRRLVFVDPADMADYPKRQPDITAGTYGQAIPTFPPDLREPPTAEPFWTTGGTYMTVRASAAALPDWDTSSLDLQQHTIGRRKVEGNFLDLDANANPDAEPVFATNPNDTTVPLNSHVRKMNPRSGPDDVLRRVFRRGYPLIEAAGSGGLRRGLLFICFGRTLTTQFEFITAGWMVNENFPQPGTGQDALRRYESEVLAGGYYFVPALTNARQPWSWSLPPS